MLSRDNRMLTRSMLVPAGRSTDLDVVCVEQGRWDGGYGHGSSGRRASMRLRNVDELVDGLRALPGQVGVVIGIAGQPVMLEAFDSPMTLRREFDAIIRAAAFDALDATPERTPARRAIRFVDRTAQVALSPVARAGAGSTVAGSSPYAALAGLGWRSRLIHLKAANPRHPLNALCGV